MSLKFKPEDFYKGSVTTEGIINWAPHFSSVAQLIFDEWLAKQSVVKGSGHSEDGSFVWFERTVANGFYTHQARLCCIEEIKKCEHPKEKVKFPYWNNMEPPTKTGTLTNTITVRWDVGICECGAKVRPREFEEVT